MKLNKLSGHTLSELQVLCSRMLGEIDNFSHVSDDLPNSIKKGMADFYEQLNAERDRREDGF